MLRELGDPTGMPGRGVVNGVMGFPVSASMAGQKIGALCTTVMVFDHPGNNSLTWWCSGLWRFTLCSGAVESRWLKVRRWENQSFYNSFPGIFVQFLGRVNWYQHARNSNGHQLVCEAILG